jgi:hypothetical protein
MSAHNETREMECNKCNIFELVDLQRGLLLIQGQGCMYCSCVLLLAKAKVDRRSLG